jgi:hypothetical protein
MEVSLRLTLLTEAGITVILQEAVLYPATVVTTMVVTPVPTAVTVPLSDTVATHGLLLTHVVPRLNTFAGEMETLSFKTEDTSPSPIVNSLMEVMLML